MSRITRSKANTPENALIEHQRLTLIGMGLEDDIYYYLIGGGGLHEYPFVTVGLPCDLFTLPAPGTPDNPYIKLVKNFQRHRPQDFTIEELQYFDRFRNHGGMDLIERYLERISHYGQSTFETIYNQLGIWFTIPRFRELLNSPTTLLLEVELPEKGLIFDNMTFTTRTSPRKIRLNFQELASTADR